MKQKSSKQPVPAEPGKLRKSLLGLYGIVGIALSTFGGFKVPFAESNAKDYWRHALAGIILFIGVIAGIVSFALYLFNANYFKTQIIEYVKTNNQRDLTLDGDLKVTFFPKLSLDAGKMTLSQRNSSKGFASIESGHFHIAWWPLLLKQLQIESVALNGAHANVIRYKNGTTNLDDFFSSEGNLSDIKFEIDSIKLASSSINLQDETTGYFFSLHDLNLETGKLADNVPADVTSDFRLESAKPRIDTRVKLSNHLLFDLKQHNYEMANIEGEMEGEIGGISNLALNFQGTLKTNPQSGLTTLDKVSISAKGMLEKRKLDAKLDIPSIKAVKDTTSGSKLTGNISLLQDEENLSASIEMPAFEVNEKQFKSESVSATFDLFMSGRSIQGKLLSPLSYDLNDRKLNLPSLASTYSISHPALTAKLAGTINGSLQSNMDEQSLKLNFKTKVDESNFSGTIGMQNYSQPSYSFDLSVDKLDVDRYLTTDWSKRIQDDNQPFDFSTIQQISLRGKVHANDLKFAKLNASSLNAELRIDQSSLFIDSFNARMYGGNATGSLSIDTKATPAFTLKQKLANIQLNNLTHDLLSGEPKLEGKGLLSLDLSGSGENIGALRKSISGSAVVNLGNGNFNGINLTETLLANKSQLGVKDAKFNAPAKFSESTSFSQFKSTMEISSGVAHSNDLQIKSPLFSLKGEGDIKLDTGKLNYQVTTAISPNLTRKGSGELAELKGMSIPGEISGTYASPAFALMLGEASAGKSNKNAKPASTNKAASKKTK